MSPEGIPLEQRSMAPRSKSETLQVYKLKKELAVNQAQDSLALDQPGGWNTGFA